MITCKRTIFLLGSLILLALSYPHLLAAAYINLGYVFLVRELSQNVETDIYRLSLVQPYLRANRLGQAERYFERARFLDPHSQVQGWFGSAFVYEIIKQPSKAEYAWRKVMEEDFLDGRSKLARVALGLSYVRQGHPSAAREVWAEKPNEVTLFLVHRGDGYLSTYPEQALGYYEQAQALIPDDMEIDLRIIWALIRIGQTRQALKNLELLLQRTSPADLSQKVAELYATVDEGFVWIFIGAADIYQQKGEVKSAELMLRTAVQVHEAPLTFSPLGTFYCSLGRYQEGIETLSRAKTYGAQYYALQARQRLSLCYCQAGLIDRALQEAEELARIAPLDSEFLGWSAFFKENWRQICSH